jgi:hypothetical protein
LTCHCKHKQGLPDKTDWKFTLPTGWTAEQAWAIIEILDIISADIWDIYEDKLIDHVRRKRQETYDEIGNGEAGASYQYDPNGKTNLPF